MTTHTNSRATAARILSEWLETAAFPERALDGDVPDRAFVMEVVYGVCRRRRTLDWIVKHYAHAPPRNVRVRACLLTGLYQLLYMEVEPYAAVNETVEAMKALRCPRGTLGFVNGILRRAGRETEKVYARLSGAPLAVRESHPDVLVKRWTQRYGKEPTAELCRHNNTRPPVVVSPRIGRATAEALQEQFAEAGIAVVPHPFAPARTFVLPQGTRVGALPGFRDGLFSIQDPATLKAVEALDPQPGEQVLDACAAPGGKAGLIAGAMQDRGRLVLMDLHEDRLAVLRQNVERLVIGCAEIVQADASDAATLRAAAGDAGFDRILLDVPCTNTGVLRRRPDARWRFTEKRMQRLARVQESMLDAASTVLRPGGTLVYSTCSLEPEENEDLVDAWLANHSSFALHNRITCFPPDTDTDGASVSVLHHREATEPA